jgi:hypothetical protein
MEFPSGVLYVAMALVNAPSSLNISVFTWVNDPVPVQIVAKT